MLESSAWGALSGAARQIVFRVAIEHMAHAGTENGNLIITYDDFAAFGIRRSSVAKAIRDAEALGWIKVTFRGRGGNAEFREASRYAVGWLPTADGKLADNLWRRIRTEADAQFALDATEYSHKKRPRAA
jgi:hypothetical protein